MKRTKSGLVTRLCVAGVCVSGIRQGAPEGMLGTRWYEISAVSAGKIVRVAFPGKCLPRPGYFIDLPEEEYEGYTGHWALTNRAGRYELMFHYR